MIYGKAWETDRNPEMPIPADGSPPSGLDYEIWQGPAPARPFNSTIVGGAWRWLFDYGTGDLGTLNFAIAREERCRSASRSR